MIMWGKNMSKYVNINLWPKAEYSGSAKQIRARPQAETGGLQAKRAGVSSGFVNCNVWLDGKHSAGFLLSYNQAFIVWKIYQIGHYFKDLDQLIKKTINYK